MIGMRTWRASGTSPASRSGRRRRPSGLTAALTTAEVTATEAIPVAAARRPAVPPPSARNAEQAIESLEWSAARDSCRIARSRLGVGVRAIAA